MQKKSEQALWIANISNRNVSLSDLGIIINAYSNVNLLDSKNYHFSMDEINKSVTSGSIFLKRDKIKVRNVPPGTPLKTVIKVSEGTLPVKLRSPLIVKEENYIALDLTDEKFAEENSDVVEHNDVKGFSK